MASKQWHQAVNRRLGAREALDTERAYAEFWSPLGLSLEGTQEALWVFEAEYGIPLGGLRPTDPLRAFFEPPTGRGVLSRWLSEFWSGDKSDAVMARLARRLKATGRAASHEAPLTLGAYALAWNGASQREGQAD